MRYRLQATLPINQDVVWVLLLKDHEGQQWYFANNTWNEYRDFEVLQPWIVLPGIDLYADIPEAVTKFVEGALAETKERNELLRAEVVKAIKEAV